MAPPLIELRRVSKRFAIPSVRRETLREHAFHLFRSRHWHSLQVLDAVDFTIRPGETVGLVGRNGCGKSTLLKIVSGIFQPDSGQVVTRAPITPILELGAGWNPELSGVDNVYLLGTVLGLSIGELRRSMQSILEFAELEEFANLKVQHYSSGMASRLAFSVAFTAVREILVLDEIFAVGDAGFRERCRERLDGLKRAGHTIILVSHDMDLVRSFCDRAVLLERGRIALDGSTHQVCDSYTAMLSSSATSAA
jgi:ABC-type polysaccharide/polyol phosphate transport system ATPase subunit